VEWRSGVAQGELVEKLARDWSKKKQQPQQRFMQTILRLHFWCFVFLNTLLGFLIRTFELNRIFLINYILTSIFSFVAAKPFLNQWGVYGVVYGILGTQVLNILVYSIYLKTKNIATWK
jgi:hypothetical protein